MTNAGSGQDHRGPPGGFYTAGWSAAATSEAFSTQRSIALQRGRRGNYYGGKCAGCFCSSWNNVNSISSFIEVILPWTACLNIWFILIDSVQSCVTGHLISRYLFVYLFLRVRVPSSHIHGACQHEIHHGRHKLQLSQLCWALVEKSCQTTCIQHANNRTKRSTRKTTLRIKLNTNVLRSKSCRSCNCTGAGLISRSRY